MAVVGASASQMGAWTETALVTITKYASAGGTDLEYAAITETIDIDFGDKGVDQIANLKGGRIVKKTPQDIATITFEGYPLFVASATTPYPSQMFESGTYDTSEPIQQPSNLGRDTFRVVIMWTDDVAATAAAGLTAASTNAYRVIFAHAWMTSLKPSFTDGILKFTFEFKCPAFNKNGTSQICEQSGDNTALVSLTGFGTTGYNPLSTAAAYTW